MTNLLDVVLQLYYRLSEKRRIDRLKVRQLLR